MFLQNDSEEATQLLREFVAEITNLKLAMLKQARELKASNAKVEQLIQEKLCMIDSQQNLLQDYEDLLSRFKSMQLSHGHQGENFPHSYVMSAEAGIQRPHRRDFSRPPGAVINPNGDENPTDIQENPTDEGTDVGAPETVVTLLANEMDEYDSPKWSARTREHLNDPQKDLSDAKDAFFEDIARHLVRHEIKSSGDRHMFFEAVAENHPKVLQLLPQDDTVLTEMLRKPGRPKSKWASFSDHVNGRVAYLRRKSKKKQLIN